MKLLHALADKQAEYSYRLPATPTHTLPSSSSSPARPIKPIRNKPGSYCVCFSLLLPFFCIFFNGFNIIGFSYGSCYCCCSLLPYFLSSFVVITFVDQLISVILYATLTSLRFEQLLWTWISYYILIMAGFKKVQRLLRCLLIVCMLML